MASVTRCVCTHMSFTELLSWAEDRGLKTVEELSDSLGCGIKCGMCAPFLEYALETGETIVPYPLPEFYPDSCGETGT